MLAAAGSIPSRSAAPPSGRESGRCFRGLRGRDPRERITAMRRLTQQEGDAVPARHLAAVTAPEAGPDSGTVDRPRHDRLLWASVDLRAGRARRCGREQGASCSQEAAAGLSGMRHGPARRIAMERGDARRGVRAGPDDDTKTRLSARRRGGRRRHEHECDGGHGPHGTNDTRRTAGVSAARGRSGLLFPAAELAWPSDRRRRPRVSA